MGALPFPIRDSGPATPFVPAVYVGATIDLKAAPGAVGIIFTCEDGKAVRLLLSAEGARHAGETLIDAALGVEVMGARVKARGAEVMRDAA